jgi:hypothetical protein
MSRSRKVTDIATFAACTQQLSRKPADPPYPCRRDRARHLKQPSKQKHPT